MPVLQHSICTNSILHIVSGALLNIGKLLCTVTGVSIRDLYKSCKQVIQVKEEGLVTVQSLQPVLTPITPIAGKVGCDEIGDAEGALDDVAKGMQAGGAIGGLVLGAVAGTAAGLETLKAVGGAAAGGAGAAAAGVAAGVAIAAPVAGALAVGGLVALGAAEAYVYKRKTAQKAATFGIELAKGGMVTGAVEVAKAQAAMTGLAAAQIGAAGKIALGAGTAKTAALEVAKGGNTHMHYTHAMFYPCTLVIAKPPYPKT